MVNLDLIIHNWRCFENKHFTLPYSSFVITDDNGSGKTSLLSAYYSLFTGQPWPQTKFSESLQKDTVYYGLITGYPDWSLTGQISPNGRLISKFQKPQHNPLIPNTRHFPRVFTYLPSDNTWFNLSRSSKLATFDTLLILCYGEAYSEPLKQLTKHVKAKNELIRHSIEQQTTDITLVISLSEKIYLLSIDIWHFRMHFFSKLGFALHNFQDWIQNSSADITIKHEVSNEFGNKYELIKDELPPCPDWHALWKKELIVGKVLFGAQRDDFSLLMGHIAIQNMFSRGEMRLLVLFIKSLAQELFLKHNPENTTIWLLDDVFNELDSTRELILFKKVLDKSQFYIITSTKKLNFPIPEFSLKDLAKK